jgi:uncharacterized membrane protein (UPF0136 family)
VQRLSLFLTGATSFPLSHWCNVFPSFSLVQRLSLFLTSLAAGGVMAYVKKGSTKSLTSAGGAALILALSSRTMLGPQAKGSIAVCLAIALLLSVIMCGRYSRTRKMMPAGVTAGVSLAMSAAYLGCLFG